MNDICEGERKKRRSMIAVKIAGVMINACCRYFWILEHDREFPEWVYRSKYSGNYMGNDNSILPDTLFDN